MPPLLYLSFAAVLLFAAFIVFRKIARRDYLVKGSLTWLSSLLQLLIFAAWMCIPYLYNPPEWPWFWNLVDTLGSWYVFMGFFLIVLGFVVAFGTMFWFGMRRAFGIQTQGLVQTGPYRYSRNPQILGGCLLVVGVMLQWPSLYALRWIALYGVIGHMMIVTEEEYLKKVYGQAYDRYCEVVPRDVGLGGRTTKIST
jgi:protein-S-isoprenylcysteine O-methyltransferase Ste14